MWRGRFVDRDVPDADIAALFDMTAEIADRELSQASEMEATATFPVDAYRTLGAAGLLSLPYQAEYGGAELASEFSLQVLEELSYSWLAVGIGVSVHNLACFPLAVFGDVEQQQEHLAGMLSGQTLGGYCLSESHSGSDAAALSTKAEHDAGEYRITGAKAWITHGPVANFFSVMARTGEAGPKGISCFLVDAQTPGVQPATPERKMGANSSPTSSVMFDDVVVPERHLIGAEGQGFSIALAALDAGRLGIAACAVGLAQAALDAAVVYARDRQQFRRSIIDFQGVSFTLADMAAGIYAARAAYLAAARLKDQGEPFSTQAAMAKLIATDTAMRVANDAVGILGGAGYTRDYPVERYFREAKVLQIVEGTNQIQRMVIGRALRP
jgi:alkylation response protein AidB-like acyl-CoA dehydrogenase